MLHVDRQGFAIDLEKDGFDIWPLSTELQLDQVQVMQSSLWCTLVLPSVVNFLDDVSLQSQVDFAIKISKSLARSCKVYNVIFAREFTYLGVEEKSVIKNEVCIKKVEMKPPNLKSNEENQRTGWGAGKRISTSHRFAVFRSWLEDEYGIELLQRGVLDVAGGKGDLSFLLTAFSGIPATIVDPRP